MPFLALTALTALHALTVSPARPAPAPLACITMNTEKLPLATRRVRSIRSASMGSSDVKVCYGRPCCAAATCWAETMCRMGSSAHRCQRADHDSHQRTAGRGGHQGSRGLPTRCTPCPMPVSGK
jgi:hypothetical protein